MMMLDFSYEELIREIEGAEGRPLCDYSKARILQVITDREKASIRHQEKLHKIDRELSILRHSLFQV